MTAITALLSRRKDALIARTLRIAISTDIGKTTKNVAQLLKYPHEG